MADGDALRREMRWNLDDLLAWGITFVEEQAAALAVPDAHFASYALATTGVVDAAGELVFSSLSLDVPEGDQSLSDETLGNMVRDARASMVAVVAQTVVSRPGGDEPVETVMVYVANATQKRYRIAPLVRVPGAPPKLGTWRDADGERVVGRLIEPMRLALLETALSA